MGFELFVLVVAAISSLAVFLINKSFPGIRKRYKILVFLVMALGVATVLSLLSGWGQPLLKLSDNKTPDDTWLKWLITFTLFIIAICYIPVLLLSFLFTGNKKSDVRGNVEIMSPIMTTSQDVMGTTRPYNPLSDQTFSQGSKTKNSIMKKIGFIVALEVIANVIAKIVIKSFSRLGRVIKNFRRA